MYCDNCGAQTDDDTAFCSRCGQQLLAQKAPMAPSPCRPSKQQIKRFNEDNLCFGEDKREEGSGWIGGLVLIAVGIFLIIIFYFPDFPIEFLIPVGFIFFGIFAIINHSKRRRRY